MAATDEDDRGGAAGAGPFAWLNRYNQYLPAPDAALRLLYRYIDGWSADLSFSYYQQRPGWRIFGPGRADILPMMARWIAFGISRTF